MKLADELRWKRKEESDPRCERIKQLLRDKGPMTIFQIVACLEPGNSRDRAAIFDAVAICLISGSVWCNAADRTYRLSEPQDPSR